MSYLIDARFERGEPSLTLIDAKTGEQRLHWCCAKTARPETAWQSLFKQLALIACADRLSLIQRAKSPAFGEDCIECKNCAEHPQATTIYKPLMITLQDNLIAHKELPQ